jgi:hypothetical protein
MVGAVHPRAVVRVPWAVTSLALRTDESFSSAHSRRCLTTRFVAICVAAIAIREEFWPLHSFSAGIPEIIFLGDVSCVAQAAFCVAIKFFVHCAHRVVIGDTGITP